MGAGATMGAVHGPAGSEIPRAAIDAFCFAGALVGSEPVPGGHIHGNALVTCTGGRYLLQRLNDRVFPDVDVVCANVERVVAHLRATGHRAPPLVPTRTGALSHRATDGSVWRAFPFLEGTVGRLLPTGPDDAFEAARAFARYMTAMADLPGPPLAVPIARFHDLPHRREALDAAAAADRVGRLSGTRHDLDRARRLSHQVIEGRGAGGPAPSLRTVHNDAKLSNVRFDAVTGLAAGVVDFDTTGAGHARYDLGELIRSATTHAPEDSTEESAVDFDMELFDALSTGYFSTRPGLERQEVDTMALAGPEMAVENALRFLTDHLDGDRYFAVDRPDQNLDRGRTQLRLTELILASQADVAASIARAAGVAGPAVPDTSPRVGPHP
jgi:N-acetylhexosamine 1-kinase